MFTLLTFALKVQKQKWVKLPVSWHEFRQRRQNTLVVMVLFTHALRVKTDETPILFIKTLLAAAIKLLVLLHLTLACLFSIFVIKRKVRVLKHKGL